MLEFVSMGIKRDVYVPQTVFLPDMGKYDTGQLVAALKGFGPTVTIVFIHNPLKC
jgi:hypothetical protein